MYALAGRLCETNPIRKPTTCPGSPMARLVELKCSKKRRGIIERIGRPPHQSSTTDEICSKSPGSNLRIRSADIRPTYGTRFRTSPLKLCSALACGLRWSGNYDALPTRFGLDDEITFLRWL